MRNQAWLDSLKPGDTVVIEHYRYGKFNYSIAKVDRVTPSGRKVVKDVTFNKHGDQMGQHSAGISISLEEPTPEMLERVKRQKLEAQVKKVFEKTDVKEISTEALELLGLIFENVDRLTPEVCKEMTEAYWGNSLNDVAW